MYNKQNIDRARGHAAALKPLIHNLLVNAEAIQDFADLLDESQVIIMNSRLFDNLIKLREIVTNFHFGNWDEEELPGDFDPLPGVQLTAAIPIEDMDTRSVETIIKDKLHQSVEGMFDPYPEDGTDYMGNFMGSNT